MKLHICKHLECTRKALHRLFCQKRCTLTRALIIILAISFTSFVALNYHHGNQTVKTKTANPPRPSTSCNYLNFKTTKERGPNNHGLVENTRTGKRVLVFVESPYTKHAKDIVNSLEAARFPYKIVMGEKSLPILTHMDKGRFSAIIFERIQLYLDLDYWNRQLIEKYCREYDIGMILFVKPQDDLQKSFEKVPGFPLNLQYNLALKDYRLNPISKVWRITRPGEVITSSSPHEDWTVFVLNHTTYEPLAFAKVAPSFYGSGDSVNFEENATVIAALLDHGLHDGIRRVFFGNLFKFWLHKPMILDCLSYLSRGKLSLPLERYIQIDIDDIFVGKAGTRMKAQDVEALVSSQSRLQALADGFRFNLGFSGWYYLNGNDEEDDGDRKLIEYARKFYWFPHMWRHEQAHKFGLDTLLRNMQENLQFAKDYELPVDYHYAVAPHHSGVYPVHEDLYTAWKSVWDVRVTSTEEYPRLYPSYARRGFIHRGIMVLPRQTCGLFTHTYFMDEYPGGRERLDRSIKGGELFQTFLYNPFNIYMTHLSNYGNDRLALYVFESALKFVNCWTNLKIQQLPPIEMAMKYFDMFPEESSPIWRNPCDYERHKEIWSSNKTCDRFPKFLVVGPQKTGTTALYTFLGMHPAIKSNFNSQETFEEIQFFNGNNYYKGIDWYIEYFPKPVNSVSEVLFEKSATYFDTSLVPMRVHALLPHAKIVCILVNPARRAYSWYQHMRAHQDPVATNMSFYDVITASGTAPSKVQSLRNRCLNPGLYSQHLNDWLDYFPPRQLYIIDGDELKDDPVTVMNKLQKFLRIEPFYDYNQKIRFDPKKGFFCQVTSDDRTKCLGKSKGRQYPPIDEQSDEYLKQFYNKHNVALSKLLDRINLEKPEWLTEALKE